MCWWDSTRDYSASHAVGLGCSNVGAQIVKNIQGGLLRCLVPWQGRLEGLGLETMAGTTESLCLSSSGGSSTPCGLSMWFLQQHNWTLHDS